jgi:hypothetical protein
MHGKGQFEFLQIARKPRQINILTRPQSNIGVNLYDLGARNYIDA